MIVRYESPKIENGIWGICSASWGILLDKRLSIGRNGSKENFSNDSSMLDGKDELVKSFKKISSNPFLEVSNKNNQKSKHIFLLGISRPWVERYLIKRYVCSK